MSFLIQRIVNRYPHWSKIRQDPSTLGQRLIEPFAETFEALQANQLRLDDELHLLRYWTGLGQLWNILLEEEDFFPRTRNTSGGLVYTYPTVVGDGQTLIRYETFEELAFGAPSRLEILETISYTDYLVWSSDSPATFNSLPDSQRLWITISNSTEWYKKTPSRNPLFEGTSFVRITGIDINDLVLVEVLTPKDDGLYRGSHFFKEVTSVEYEGFDGDVNVYWASAQQEILTDPYRVIVFEDFEAPLKYRWDVRTVDSVEYTFLSFVGDRFKLGNEYRRPGFADLDNEELLGDTVLVDRAGEPYVAVDFAFSDFHGLLFVLSSSGMVHVYDPRPTPFGISQLTTTPSLDSYMRVEALTPYASYGDTQKLFSRLHRPRYPVTYVVFKRVSPSGVIEYLQADLSWDVTLYKHRPSLSSNQFNWQEITFETEYDEFGQWEYWTTCQTEKDSTVSYTAVMVDKLTALVSLDTELEDQDSISFGRADELQVGDGMLLTRFSLHKDGFLAQEERNQIILREEYETVEVTY